MKRIFISIGFLIMGLCTGCNNQIPTQTRSLHTYEVVMANKIYVNAGKCRISINPQLELLGVVQFLADDELIRKDEHEYTQEIQSYFSAYREDPVVALYKEMKNIDFRYGRIPELTLRLDNYLEFIDTTGNHYYPQESQQKRIIEFVELLADFCVKTQFNKFFSDHEDYYKRVLSQAEGVINRADVAGNVIRYYGYEQGSYNIVLYPLASGGFAERIQRDDGTYDTYCFASAPTDSILNLRLIFHEFGHSYTGPLVYENFEDDLIEYKHLYDPIEKSMRNQQYKDWINCVDEHIVRAATNRIVLNSYGQEASDEHLKYNLERDFIYIEKLWESLAVYEENRDKYPTLNDYFPELIKVFKYYSESEEAGQ